LSPEQRFAVWRVWAADVRDGILPGDRRKARVLCRLLDWARDRPQLATGRTCAMLINELLKSGTPPPPLPNQ
jgi:hypothetical protein